MSNISFFMLAMFDWTFAQGASMEDGVPRDESALSRVLPAWGEDHVDFWKDPRSRAIFMVTLGGNLNILT